MKNIVFLPGMLCDERLYAHQIEYFKNNNYQVITPALVGHKKNLSDLAKELLNNLPDEFVIVAASLGGSVALEMIKQDANRASHLILIGAVDSAFTEQQAQLLKNQIQKAKDTNYLDVVAEELKPSYINQDNPNYQLVLDQTYAMAKSFDIAKWEEQANLLYGRQSYRDVLINYKGKTLICAGETDRRVSLEVVTDMAKALNQDVVLFETCGHLPSIEKPELVTTTIAYFLNN